MQTLFQPAYSAYSVLLKNIGSPVKFFCKNAEKIYADYLTLRQKWMKIRRDDLN